MTQETAEERPLLRQRAPEMVRNVLVFLAILIAVAAALAPVVYLLRRVGVG